MDSYDVDGAKAYAEGERDYYCGNFRDAVKLLRQSSKMGNAEAMYLLGLCYLNGKGVIENASAGIMWIYKAADRGSAPAQYHYGASLIDYGDISEGLYWLRKAAAQGNADAITKLRSL